MEMQPYMFVLIGVLLLFDVMRPYLFTGDDLPSESTAADQTHADKASSNKHTQSEDLNEGLRELIQMSQGGRVFISFCSS